MYARTTDYCTLLFLCSLMRQTYTESGKITCSWAKILRTPPKTVYFSNLTEKNNLAHLCHMARKISLEGKSTLTVDGIDNTERFVNWIFFAKELEMCVSVKNARNVKKVFMSTEYIVGKCEGPLLSIVNNAELKSIIIRSDLLGKNLSSIPNAVRIRGNRRLDREDLEDLKILRKKVNGDWDLQSAGGLPSNFENLRGIKSIMGRLIITNNTGLNKFDYLISLKKVGRSNGDDVAIIVKDNGDLSSLELPSLLDIELKEGGKRFESVNNPLLSSKQATTLDTDVPKRYTSVREHKESTTTHENSKEIGVSLTSQETSSHTYRINKRTVFGVIAAVASLILMCTIATCLLHWRKSSAVRRLQPAYDLHTESKKKDSSSRMGTNRSVVRSTSVSSGTDAGNTAASTSSATEKARGSPQVSRLLHNDNNSVLRHN